MGGTYVWSMSLTPTPEDVAGRVAAAVRAVWPDTDGEEGALLDRLLVYDVVYDVGDTEEHEPMHRMASFRTRGWEEPPGTLQTWRGRLLDLGWFLYGEPGGDDSRAAEGFAAIRGLLVEALGDPADEWGSAEEPAVSWQREGKSVEMHYYKKGSSVMQIDVGHQTRSADFEARTRGSGQGPAHDECGGDELDGK